TTGAVAVGYRRETAPRASTPRAGVSTVSATMTAMVGAVTAPTTPPGESDWSIPRWTRSGWTGTATGWAVRRSPRPRRRRLPALPSRRSRARLFRNASPPPLPRPDDADAVSPLG